MVNYLIAMLLGFIFSVTFHISRGMQQQGIKTLTFIRAKFRKNPSSISWKESKPTIYLLGVILSGSGAIWVILSGKFAPASYFTSMYGIGMVAMMWYSSKILKERIDKWEIIGAGILIVGTVLIGIEGLFQPKLNYADINIQSVWWIVGIFTGISLIALIWIRNHGNLIIKSVIFGIFTGGMVSFDPIFKGIGQNLNHNSAFFPTTSMGWTIFLFSLVFTTASFWITQWGFSKNVRAALLIPMHNSLYIAFPIFIQLIALPDYQFSFITILGLLLILAGNLMMKLDEAKMISSNQEFN
ncbi:MAG: hypothetical protein DRI23_11465 [Candidatus Cloacimonadota bacterium]|nr:MAG: hypothetical protein DRI23_11465 [Candidatus Cloacimonadota bacterium]